MVSSRLLFIMLLVLIAGLALCSGCETGSDDDDDDDDDCAANCGDDYNDNDDNDDDDDDDDDDNNNNDDDDDVPLPCELGDFSESGNSKVENWV